LSKKEKKREKQKRKGKNKIYNNIMTKYKKVFIFFFIIIILKEILRKGKLNDFSIISKITNIKEKNNLYSISLLPTIDRDIDLTGEFKLLIDNANLNSKSLNILQKNKVSIKIRQLGKNLSTQIKRMEKIIAYANKKNIFIWIASVFKKDVEMEFEEYKKIFKKYKNVGLTIAAANYGAMERVKEIINMGGFVRLVKGHYKADIKNWNKVGDIYEEIANFMVDSGKYNCLATHDFKILKKIKEKYPNRFKNIEIAFYYGAYNYVYKKDNIDIINNNSKSFYIFYGDYLLYLMDNILHINLKRLIESRVESII